MKNKIKNIFKILVVTAGCLMFASFSPSLDGRAVVVDDGVFPQGLFAKTVGYLPGDIISVTNIAGDATVDILVIGALDPSEGVAIMLSPEAAQAMGIEKGSNNIVKITKRSGQDERVYGNAVISKSAAEIDDWDDESFDNIADEENTEAFVEPEAQPAEEEAAPEEAAPETEEDFAEESFEEEESAFEEPEVEEDFEEGEFEEEFAEPEEEAAEETPAEEEAEEEAEESFEEEAFEEEAPAEEAIEEEPLEEEALEEEALESEEPLEEDAFEEESEALEEEEFEEAEEAPAEEAFDADELSELPAEEEPLEEETIEEEAPAEQPAEEEFEEESLAEEAEEEDIPAEESFEEEAEEEKPAEEAFLADELGDLPGAFVPEEEAEEEELEELEEEAEEAEESDEYEAIVLVPVDSNPPESDSDEVEDIIAEDELESIEEESLEAAPVEINQSISVITNAPIVEDKPEATSYDKYIVPSLKDLESGKYYIQIAVYGNDENILEVINKYGPNYPITIVPMAGGKNKQILIGPVSMDEYKVVLERFKSYGFKDAFLRKVK